MLTTQITVVFVTGYFFYKVLTTPPKSNADSEEGEEFVDESTRHIVE